MGGSRASPVIVISSSDDDEEKQVALPVAAAEWSTDEDVDDDGRPGWLPDGFGMEGLVQHDGTFVPTGFICPVTGTNFSSKSEVLEYCFSGGLERAAEAKTTLDDKTTLQGKYAWLRGKPGWVIEIRAGGENMSKMFKYYAHLSSKVRLISKVDVIRFIDQGVLSDEYANYGDCDTTKEDNIIAQLDLNAESLPPGWVKEIAFRKCSNGTRKDRYYTDPISKKVFRSLKAAQQCFAYGTFQDAHDPITSVTDLYSFDCCTHMPPWLAKRLKMEGTRDKKCVQECHASCRKKARTEEAENKAARKTPGTSKTQKTRGRP